MAASSPNMSWFYHCGHDNGFTSHNKAGPPKGKHGVPSSSYGFDSTKPSSEMHFNMSKKIAQLTKVIHALHTRCDDQDTLIQTMKSCHEEKIQQLTQEMKLKLQFYKAKIGKEAEMKQQIDTLHASVSEHRKYMQQMKEELINFKQDGLLGNIEEPDSDSSSINELRSESSSKLSDSQKSISPGEHATCEPPSNESDDAIREIRNKYEANISHLLTELSCSKCDQTKLQVSKKELQMRFDKSQTGVESLKSQIRSLETKNDEMKDSISAMSSSIEDLTRRNNNLTVRFEAESKRLKSKTAELNSQEKLFQEKMSLLDSGLNRAISEREKAQKLLEESEKSKIDELSQARSRTKNLEHCVEDIEVKYKTRVNELLLNLTQSQNTLERSCHEFRNLQAIIKEKNNALETSKEQWTNSKSEIHRLNLQIKQSDISLLHSQTANKQFIQEINEKNDQIGNFELRLEELKGELANNKNELKQANISIEEFETQIFDLHQQVKHEKINYTNTIEELEARLRKCIAEKKTVILEFEKDIQSQKDAHLTRQQQLRNDYEYRIKELTANMEAEHHRLTESHAKTVEKFKSDLKEQRSQMQIMTDERDKLKENSNMMIMEKLEIQNNNEELTKQLKEERRQIEELTSELKNLTSVKDSLENGFHDLTKANCDVRNQNAKLQAELDDLKSKLKSVPEEVLKKANHEFEEKLKTLTEKHEQNLKLEAKSSAENAMKNCKNAMLHIIEKVLMEQECKTKVGDQIFKKRFEDMQEKLNSSKSEMEKRLAEEKTTIEKIKVMKNKENVNLMKKLTEEQNTNKELVDAAHKEQEQLRSTLADKAQSDLLEQRRSLLEQHKAEINSLKSGFQNQTEWLKRDMMEKNEKNMKELEIRLRQEFIAVNIRAQKTVTDKFEEQTEKLKSQIQTTETDKTQLIEQLQAKNQHVTMWKEEHKKIVDKKTSEICQLAGEITQLQKRLIIMSAEMDEKSQHISKLQKQNFSYNKMVENDKRCESRESRPEDLALIQQLRNILIERDKVIMKCNEEKKRLYFELANKDKSYSKMVSGGHSFFKMFNPITQKKKSNSDQNRLSVPLFKQQLQQLPDLQPYRSSPISSPFFTRPLRPVEFRTDQTDAHQEELDKRHSSASNIKDEFSDCGSNVEPQADLNKSTPDIQF